MYDVCLMICTNLGAKIHLFSDICKFICNFAQKNRFVEGGGGEDLFCLGHKKPHLAGLPGARVLVLDARCTVQGYCVFLVLNMSNCFTALSKSDSKDFISLSRLTLRLPS